MIKAGIEAELQETIAVTGVRYSRNKRFTVDNYKFNFWNLSVSELIETSFVDDLKNIRDCLRMIESYEKIKDVYMASFYTKQLFKLCREKYGITVGKII